MASLLHCMVPQLVARSGASAVRQRTLATLSSPSSSSSAPAKATTNAAKSAAGKVSGSTAINTTATATAAKAATPPPATPAGSAAAQENPLWVLWRDHKHNKWAIGTVIVAALMGDAAVSWALFGKKKDGETQEGVDEAISQAQNVANTSVAATVA